MEILLCMASPSGSGESRPESGRMKRQNSRNCQSRNAIAVGTIECQRDVIRLHNSRLHMEAIAGRRLASWLGMTGMKGDAFGLKDAWLSAVRSIPSFTALRHSN